MTVHDYGFFEAQLYDNGGFQQHFREAESTD